MGKLGKEWNKIYHLGSWISLDQQNREEVRGEKSNTTLSTFCPWDFPSHVQVTSYIPDQSQQWVSQNYTPAGQKYPVRPGKDCSPYGLISSCSPPVYEKEVLFLPGTKCSSHIPEETSAKPISTHEAPAGWKPSEL